MCWKTSNQCFKIMIFQGTDHWRIKPGGCPGARGGSGAAHGNACVRRKRKDPCICIYTHTIPSARRRGENGCWTQRREGSERVEPWSWGMLSFEVCLHPASKHLTHSSHESPCVPLSACCSEAWIPYRAEEEEETAALHWWKHTDPSGGNEGPDWWRGDRDQAFGKSRMIRIL